MAEENNNNNSNTPDITELIKSLQTENSVKPDIGGEGFPFSQDFDIDAFMAANDSPSDSQPSAVSSMPKEISEDFSDTLDTSDFNNTAEDYNFDEPKDDSIRSLEDQIADLETRLGDSSAKDKGFSLSDDDLDLDEIGSPEASQATASLNSAAPAALGNMDDFYKNIANTIGTLKDSLEGMTKRVQSEQAARIQEKNLVNRLRDKTTQLKAINLTLNTEVKRAKGEKLEALRQNAQKTKELLAMRMQLSKVEEKAKHGDFKLSRLEQQLSVISEQKSALDEEITSIREEKLKSLRHSLQQTKEIMALRMELAKTEEKFKYEEVSNNQLKEQLHSLQEQQKALNEEVLSTRREKEAAARQNTQYISNIESLKQQIAAGEERLLEEATTAGNLKESILSLETQMQLLLGEKTSLLVKLDENVKELETTRADYQRQIEALKQAQLQEVEQLKSQKQQEADTITLELKRAEDKYRQEELFVNTLKMQIESLQGDLKGLTDQKQALEGKSTDLANQLEAIKEAHTNEITNLRNELNSALEKFEKEKNSYNALKEQLTAVETERNTLSEEIKALASAKDDALAQNQQYLQQIEGLKREHEQIESNLKQEMQAFQQKYEEEKAKFQAEKENALVAKNKEIEELLSAKEQEKHQFSTEIEKLKGEAASAREAQSSNNILKQQIEDRSTALFFAQAALKEKENVLEGLKGDISFLNNEKVLIEAEFKKATDERYQILTQLEAKTKELEAFQQKYQTEIQALKETKDREFTALETKYTMVQDRLKAEEENTKNLRAQIYDLEKQRDVIETQATSIKEEHTLRAKRIAMHADEILALKSELARAESRSMQDMALAEQLKEKVGLVENVRASLEAQLVDLQKENTALKFEIKDKEIEIQSLKTVLAQTEETLKQEQATVKQLQEHTVKLKAVNSALDREIRKVQQEKVTALRKSAEQAQEILILKDQLTKAGSVASTLNFENGIISIRKEYEAKVEKLETELKDASALFAKQVQEIQGLHSENERLKIAEQEKIKLESEYQTLSQKADSLEKQLQQYSGATKESSLMQAKLAALSAQIAKINREKLVLQEQLAATQTKIAELEEGENKSNTAFSALKDKISTNDVLIEKLKRDIIKLTAENNDLKEGAQISVRRQQVLEAKISEVEKENMTLTGTLNQKMNATQPPAVTQAKEATAQSSIIKTEKTAAGPEAKQQPAVTEAPKADTIKTETVKTETVKTTPPAATTAQGIKKLETQKGTGESPILNFEDESTEIEVVDVESDQMDLSMIFGEETFREDDPENKPQMKHVDENTIKPRTLKTGPIGASRAGLPKHTISDEDPFDELDITDHSPHAHRIIRKPVGRVPHSYRSEAYSDFLKKTKSIFFRIKWSVFKD